jgi:hypothetical protein
MSRELEQKEDEIRGLKAIIHSLSRDSVPSDNVDLTQTPRPSSFRPQQGESIEDRLTREKLDREVAELRALLDSKTSREEELERELDSLRRGSIMTAVPPGHRASAMTIGSAGGNDNRSSMRDSRGTVIGPVGAGSSPESLHQQHKGLVAPLKHHHHRGPTLDTMPESDAYSTATENSTLWCEICETSGHDILTCTNVFGPEQRGDAGSKTNGGTHGHDADVDPIEYHHQHHSRHHDTAAGIKPAPLSPVKSAAPAATRPAPPQRTNTNGSSLSLSNHNNNATPTVRTIPNPMDAGPVAGKESGAVDASKWCALCERDGHDSVDCPFEDAF